MTSITLDLPLPVSLNGAYFNLPNHGRAPTRKLKAWKVEAGWKLKEQRPGRIAGPYEVEILIARTKGLKTSDADNRAKAVVDLLVEYGVTDDDRHMISCKTRWVEPDVEFACRVTVWPSMALSG